VKRIASILSVTCAFTSSIQPMRTGNPFITTSQSGPSSHSVSVARWSSFHENCGGRKEPMRF
jgi:hypothetical protein